LAAFGSTVGSKPDPGDLDLAILADHSGPGPDFLAVLGDLMELTEFEGIDLMHLNRAGPVAREGALVNAEILYESKVGIWANAVTAATMERMDTQWLRDLSLTEMAL